jgi:signal transduction histidine kinase
MNTARALLERLSLPQQAWMLGIATTVLAAALWLWWAASPERQVAPASSWWALAGTGALATAATGWAAARTRRAHQAVGGAARAIAREAPGSEPRDLPLRTESTDLLDTTAALRRAVESLRQRIDTLTAQNAALAARLSLRTQELSSLQDLSIGLARRGNDLAGLVDEALQALGRAMPFSSASVWARTDLEPSQPVVLLGYRSEATELSGLALADLDGLRLSRANLQRYTQIEQTGEPIIENHPQQGLLAWLWAMVTDDARTSALYRSTRSWMAVPLAVRDAVRERVLGVLRVDHTEPGHFDDERARLLTAVASQTALALRQAHLATRERDNAVTAERNRLARDLHDAVSQTLFAANLVAGTLNKDLSLPEAARVQAQTLARLNQGALAEMRMLMFELRPDALASLPLAELLQQAAAALAARGEVDVQVQVDPADPPLAMRIELYRVAQEALSNAARHSGARHVRLQWRADVSGTGPHAGTRSGCLTVHDDGRGFDPGTEHPGHFGITNMKERAGLLGGTCRIESTPGAGTTVTTEVRWET